MEANYMIHDTIECGYRGWRETIDVITNDEEMRQLAGLIGQENCPTGIDLSERNIVVVYKSSPSSMYSSEISDIREISFNTFFVSVERRSHGDVGTCSMRGQLLIASLPKTVERPTVVLAPFICGELPIPL